MVAAAVVEQAVSTEVAQAEDAAHVAGGHRSRSARRMLPALRLRRCELWKVIPVGACPGESAAGSG